MKLNPWLRCPNCGRIHTRAYIGPVTECRCGKPLWLLAWEVGSDD